MASLLWLIAAYMDLVGSGGGQKGGQKRGVIAALAVTISCLFLSLYPLFTSFSQGSELSLWKTCERPMT